jgi:hypothetical protein
MSCHCIMRPGPLPSLPISLRAFARLGRVTSMTHDVSFQDEIHVG